MIWTALTSMAVTDDEEWSQEWDRNRNSNTKAEAMYSHLLVSAVLIALATLSCWFHHCISWDVPISATFHQFHQHYIPSISSIPIISILDTKLTYTVLEDLCVARFPLLTYSSNECYIPYCSINVITCYFGISIKWTQNQLWRHLL